MYGFIGCGKMGSAIAGAIRKVTDQVLVSDPSPVAKSFAESSGIRYGSNDDAVSCDCVYLALKPQHLRNALAPLQKKFAEKKPLIVSMAAGVAISQIEEMVGTKLPVIRIMPNTPVGIGSGLVLYCYNELVTDTMLDQFKNDMQFCGMLQELPENLIDAGCAVSGCGPAYVYLFIEALADGAVACGLPRDKAITFAAQTLVGSAEMVLRSGSHPGQLKDAVCSPGGSTIAGVKALENGAFRGTVMDCVVAAYEKTKTLGK